MGRKPIHLTMTSKKTGGRQALWEAMSAQEGLFSASAIAVTCGVPSRTVQTYLEALVASGHVAKEGSGAFKIAKFTGVEAPRVRSDGTVVTQGLGREQMWRTLRGRGLGEFDFRELALMASTEAVPVTEAYANDYCIRLLKAGYLLISVKSRPGKAARYRFNPAMNTGPKPPMIQRTSMVFDQNRREIVWPKVEDLGDD